MHMHHATNAQCLIIANSLVFAAHYALNCHLEVWFSFKTSLFLFLQRLAVQRCTWHIADINYLKRQRTVVIARHRPQFIQI